MVYCGKASKGCQHCRTRRIKCDRVRPQCSQCVRAGKQCPGYRDELSLMFRDENTKVIQRAHAQWGVPGSADGLSSSTSSGSPSSSGSPFSFVNGDGSPIATTPASRRSSSVHQALIASERIPSIVQPTMSEKGMQFYVDHYVLGYPQEVQTPAELQDAQWLSSPDIADIMAAVGLSGLSNLTGNAEMEVAAREKYGLVLRSVAKSLQNPTALAHDPRAAIRKVVLLTIFEVVQGTSETAVSIRAHIMGAAALLSSLVPKMPQALLVAAFRGIIQLCFSMLIPCHLAGITVPGAALEWIIESKKSLPPDDKSSAELLLILSRFLQLSASLQGLSLIHSQPVTRKLLSDALHIEQELATWEEQQRQPKSTWAYTTEEEASFPPESAFKNRYHVYVNGMWSARVWNHYRWARILVNQTILELDTQAEVLDFRDQERHHDTVRRMADDLLVSLPTHFRHPRLTRAHRDLLDRTCKLPPGAAGGVGSAGIPSLLVQLRVAGSAPGVPREYGEWVIQVLDTVWAETGMLQAQIMAGQLRAHLAGGPRVKIEVVEVKQEHEVWVGKEPLALRSG